MAGKNESGKGLMRCHFRHFSGSFNPLNRAFILKIDKTTSLHQHLQEFLYSAWRRRHNLHVTPSQLYTRRRHMISRQRHKIITRPTI
nr:hypothetical protein [Tanacetum cinerariifolium]